MNNYTLATLENIKSNIKLLSVRLHRDQVDFNESLDLINHISCLIDDAIWEHDSSGVNCPNIQGVK